MLSSLPEYDTEKDTHVLGSGNEIPRAIVQNIQEGSFHVLSNMAYELAFAENKSIDPDSQDLLVVIRHPKAPGFEVFEKTVTIYIDESLPGNDNDIVNDNGNALRLCRRTVSYGTKKFEIPLIVMGTAQIPEIKSRLSDMLLQYAAKNFSMYALFGLPAFLPFKTKAQAAIQKRWEKASLENILKDAEMLKKAESTLGVTFALPEGVDTFMASKLDFHDVPGSLSNILRISGSGILSMPEQKMNFAKTCVDQFPTPDTYSDVAMLQRALGIDSEENAAPYREIFDPLYTDNVLRSLLFSIADGTFQETPGLFTYDRFFNEYAEQIAKIESYVPGLRIFQPATGDFIQNGINFCVAPAALRLSIATLYSMNANLVDEKGFNIYKELHKHDVTKAESFLSNLKAMDECLRGVFHQMNEKLTTEKESAAPYKNRPKKKIIVFDTCALIHNPEILEYVADDEYVRIPTRVVAELGSIKDRHLKGYSTDDETVRSARKVANLMEQDMKQVFNVTQHDRFCIEDSHKEILPVDLEPQVPDHQVFSVALYYHDEDTILVTDDRLLRLMTESQDGIRGMTGDEFIRSHARSYMSQSKRIEKAEQLRAKAIAAEAKTKTTAKQQTVKPSDTIPETVSSKPIQELKKYHVTMDMKIIQYLKNNHIQTIGQFLNLTEDAVRKMRVSSTSLSSREKVRQLVASKQKIIDTIKNNN